MWVLEIESWSSRRAASAVNHWRQQTYNIRRLGTCLIDITFQILDNGKCKVYSDLLKEIRKQLRFPAAAKRYKSSHIPSVSLPLSLSLSQCYWPMCRVVSTLKWAVMNFTAFPLCSPLELCFRYLKKFGEEAEGLRRGGGGAEGCPGQPWDSPPGRWSTLNSNRKKWD